MEELLTGDLPRPVRSLARTGKLAADKRRSRMRQDIPTSATLLPCCGYMDRPALRAASVVRMLQRSRLESHPTMFPGRIPVAVAAAVLALWSIAFLAAPASAQK